MPFLSNLITRRLIRLRMACFEIYFKSHIKLRIKFKNMARIAVISTMEASSWGGSEYLWAAMAEQALSEKHEVFISICDWSVSHLLVRQLQQQGAQLLPRARSSSLLSRIFKKTRAKISFIPLKSPYQTIFECKPDVICISQGGISEANQPELLNLLTHNSLPYLIISHLNVDNFIFNSITLLIAQKLFSQAAHHVFVSHNNQKLAERQLAQSLPNAVLLQNPVNLSEVTMVPWPSQSTICFANVARLDAALKSQDVLFETLSSPTWKQRNWQCRLYGSGPDQAYLEALAQHYDITHKVEFMGHVNDIRSIWSDNHLLLLPSRAEGTPLALVEAMLCGRPAVVTDVGGNAEWIEEAQTGFVAETATAKSFSAALNRAWLAQIKWQQMGIKAHEYAITKIDYSPGQSLLKLVLDASKK